MADHVELARASGWQIERRHPGALQRVLSALWRFCRRKPLGAIGGLIIVALLVMAAFAEWIAPYAYDQSIRNARLRPPGSGFLLGTDNISRDIFSRIVYGARVSVTVGFATVFLATLLATTIGITSGYFGGRYDLVIQRIVDAWQSFPFLVLKQSRFWMLTVEVNPDHVLQGHFFPPAVISMPVGNEIMGYPIQPG